MWIKYIGKKYYQNTIIFYYPILINWVFYEKVYFLEIRFFLSILISFREQLRLYSKWCNQNLNVHFRLHLYTLGQFWRIYSGFLQALFRIILTDLQRANHNFFRKLIFIANIQCEPIKQLLLKIILFSIYRTMRIWRKMYF